MCFSAEVSFAASVGLFAIGTKTVLTNENKKARLLSYIPIIFAIHQFSEGMNWLLYYENNNYIKLFFNYTYAYIEYCFWTIYMPLAVYIMEPDANEIRKKLTKLLFICGIGYSLYWLYYILQGNIIVHNACLPDCGGLSYIVNFPKEFLNTSKILYLSIVTGAMLLSSYKSNKVYGILMGLSWIISNEYYLKSFGSIWCFFSGVLSCVIYISIKESNLNR